MLVRVLNSFNQFFCTKERHEIRVTRIQGHGCPESNISSQYFLVFSDHVYKGRKSQDLNVWREQEY